MRCPAPEPGEGMAIGLADQFDCISETLGRDGFLAVANYFGSNGIISAILAISVALIGYRLLLGDRINLRFGGAWVIKVGVVLTLLTGWTAFQTLFYDLMVGGPKVIAETLLASLGQSSEATRETLQRTYDALRLGTLMSPETFRTVVVEQSLQPDFQMPTAMPEAASSMLVATVGFEGSVKVAIGFLLAIAPAPISCLLFAYSEGLFWAWLRALFAGFFALAGVLTISTLHVSTLASSVARVYDDSITSTSIIDDVQIIPTITTIFVLVALALLFAVFKASGHLVVVTKTTLNSFAEGSGTEKSFNDISTAKAAAADPNSVPDREQQIGGKGGGKIVALTDSLNKAVVRDTQLSELTFGSTVPSVTPHRLNNMQYANGRAQKRRVLGRQHISLKHRDTSK